MQDEVTILWEISDDEEDLLDKDGESLLQSIIPLLPRIPP
jgi:hypothetical protein